MTFLALYCAQKHGLVPSEWTFGILFHVHKFPLGEHGQEHIQVGFNLAQGTEIRHESTWGVMDDVVAVSPSNVGQFSPSFRSDKAIAKSSYDAVAKICGDNTNALDLLETAVQALAMH